MPCLLSQCMSYALAESTETDESNEWLVFEVTDTGCGISQRGLASLFTEYVQVGFLLSPSQNGKFVFSLSCLCL